MNIKIDKNIPIQTGGYGKYPFREMEVGDSFYLPDHDSRVSAAQCAKRYSDRSKDTIKFISRKWKTGYRIWRIK